MDSIEILDPKTSYQLNIYEMTDEGEKVVNPTVIRFLTGDPKDITKPRNQGVLPIDLLKLLLIHIASKNDVDISSITDKKVNKIRKLMFEAVLAK